MARLSMLIDLTRCIGCDACTVACKQENGTPVDVFFARVLNVEVGRYPHVKRLYLPMLCYHCENPPCLKACPNKAIFKRPDGVVLIDQDRCRGTGACVSACPYGNIVLKAEDSWYLNSDEPYERDFVKPRLNTGVARKCTYCVQRVDRGLDPACVVACPTKARIFGDLDDPASEISTYIREQERETHREVFHLLPSAGTKPAGCYLGPMASQESATLGGRAAPNFAEPLAQPSDNARKSRSISGRATVFVAVIALLLLSFASVARSQTDPKPHEPNARQNIKVDTPIHATKESDLYSTSSCMGCHGVTAMGGLGPPIAATKLTLQEFAKIVREGKSMMPATATTELSDADLERVYRELQAKPWNESQIPIAYKVGRLLSTRNVAIIFTVVTAFAFVFGVKVWLYWIRLAAPKQLWPAMLRFGLLRSLGIAVWSLFVDGFLVASLWRRSKFRWVMHGLILYGFCGLLLADVLIQIYNPTRAQMPFFSPLKMLPVIAGALALLGTGYVMVRYRKDPYIDNGMTQGRDFLFLNLLFHTLLSGFLTVVMKRAGITDWVMPIYLYHLSAVLLLLATAPFTRFAHAWIVPTMVALTRLTDEIAKSGVDIGFQREPSLGRHHKSLRIAQDLMRQLGPEYEGDIRLRYYP
jgi:molybdopterin-containing oxidoreductase family iron-sulfur binding subunit